MANSGITAHMIVKNEDQWVWYAINAVLPYVDQLLLEDTGSRDQTVKIIKSIKNPKIIFHQSSLLKASQLTALRNRQIKQSKTPWIWLVDGDEIYPEQTAREVLMAIKKSLSIIAVRRYDLLGDVYHRQSEEVGEYQLYGEKGHLVSRLFNLNKLKNLQVIGDYPNEEYFDGNLSTLKIPKKEVYITKNYLFHTMYLQRSSLGKNIFGTINRSKYKIEIGTKVPIPPPKILSMPAPLELNPLKHRGIAYNLIAGIVTPFKKMKRSLWR